MASGVRCDYPDCQEFAELPVNPMGGFMPLGEWVEIVIAGGQRYHACSADHAAHVARTMVQRHLQDQADSESAAQEEQAKMEQLHRPPYVAPPEGPDLGATT